MQNKRLLFMVEVAIFTAIGLILDRLAFSPAWANGGSVSFVMVPIVLMAIRWGLKGGLATGILIGVLQMALGTAYVFHPVQVLLDYPLAFAGVGLAGILAGPIKRAAADRDVTGMVTKIVAAIFIGAFVRFLCHFAAGVVFFGEFAPEGTPVWIYSLVYNGTYMGASFALTAVVAGILFSTAPRLVSQQTLSRA